MSEKISVELPIAYRLLHPMHTVLVSSKGRNGKPNIITIAWAMPTSADPPIVAISISPNAYSHKLIEETKEFVVNIPTVEILRQVKACGMVSGRGSDKFGEIGLTPFPAKKVRIPLIKECVAHMECRVVSQLKTGDHTVFVGEVVHARANQGAFIDNYDVEKAKMLFHLDGNKFATLNNKILS